MISFSKLGISYQFDAERMPVTIEPQKLDKNDQGFENKEKFSRGYGNFSFLLFLLSIEIGTKL